MISDGPGRHRAAERTGMLLLGLAVLLAVVLGCRHIAEPWEDGFRGINGGAYTGNFEQYYLQFGLAATRGCGVTVVEPLDPPVFRFYLNHPNTFPLLVLIPCSLLGVSELVIRGTVLLLFLPAIPALFFVARRFLGPRAAGAAALLFASSPMTAYFGPMANPDGSTLMATVLTIWTFLRYTERPTCATALALGAAWILACLLDWTGLFAGITLLLLVPLTGNPRLAFKAVLALGAITVLPLALIVAHASWISGGLRPALETLRVLTGNAGTGAVSFADLVAIQARHLWHWAGWPLLGLAAAGLLSGLLPGLLPRSAWRRAAGCGAALLVPGVLNAAVFQDHAAVHDYWMIHSMPGIAILAAIPIAWSIEARGRSAWLALVGVTLLAGTVAFGSVATIARVDESQTTLYRDLGDLFNSRFDSGDVIATAGNVRLASYYTHACLVGPISQPREARAVLERYGQLLAAGHCIGFVLPESAADTNLGRYVATLASRERLGSFLLYRVTRLPARSR